MKRIVILGAAAVLLATVAWTQTDRLRTGDGTARGSTGMATQRFHFHTFSSEHDHPLPEARIREIVREEIAAAR